MNFLITGAAGFLGSSLANKDPGTARYEVAGAPLPPGQAGPIAINELQADNGETIADPAGEHDDWIELLNRSAEPASLLGLYPSDDADDPLAYALPDVTLAPGERYLVWADGDVDQGPEHAPFGLSKDGELLQLATEDAVIDQTAFGPQATDRSWARQPDGTGDFADCARPSPGEANDCAAEPPTATTAPPGTPPTPTPTATPSPTAEGPRWRAYVPFAER